MVHDLEAHKGIHDEAVLRAMRETERQLFVPLDRLADAYEDRALAIGYGATISAPHIVAAMTEMLELHPADRVLEIGTGSGYQAAILSRLAKEVYSIEVVEPLARSAERRLRDLHYTNVTVRYGDGYHGWAEHGPFDKIILTAAPPELPQALVDQLKNGGRLIAPVGADDQKLVIVDRDQQGQVHMSTERSVAFVPMVRGRHVAKRSKPVKKKPV
jgi:protein-L-isoaspartate(D-aspartate) O-methyltransferase